MRRKAGVVRREPPGRGAWGAVFWFARVCHPRAVAAVDLVDETFIAADPARVAAVFADSARWAQWWPDLGLTVFMDRGIKGIRWSVTGEFAGSTEVWIQPCLDGALVHYYLRLDPNPAARDATGKPGRGEGEPSEREAARIRARRAKSWKRAIWALKDELEAGRRPGEPTSGVERGDAAPGVGSPSAPQ